MHKELIEKLGSDEAWDVIQTNQIGRIASAREGAPDIYPVSYLVHDWKIYLRTGDESRLRRETENKLVAFEAATQTATTFASTVALGVLSVVLSAETIAELDQLVILRFSEETDCVWMELNPQEVRGRRLDILSP